MNRRLGLLLHVQYFDFQGSHRTIFHKHCTFLSAIIRKSVFEFFTQCVHFLLSRDKYQDSSTWQHSVYFANLKMGRTHSTISKVHRAYLNIYMWMFPSFLKYECTTTFLYASLRKPSIGVLLLKWMVTGNWRESTLTTGGTVLNSRRFSVKSSTLSVADIMISFRGFPF